MDVLIFFEYFFFKFKVVWQYGVFWCINVDGSKLFLKYNNVIVLKKKFKFIVFCCIGKIYFYKILYRDKKKNVDIFDGFEFMIFRL